MKILFLGGTGTISTAVVARCLAKGYEPVLLNRGTRPAPAGVRSLVADIHDPPAVAAALGHETFDCVCQFIGYNADDATRDIRLFSGRTKQYIFISSASAYQKPAMAWPITESTPLVNPYWGYSRGKADAERVLMQAYAESGFPVTIVRPSHTYSERKVPLGLHGANGSWQVLQRMLDGKAVILPGDGTSLWALTHASDFAKGYVGLIGNPHALGNAYHITTDEVMSWNEIYGVVADTLGVPLHAAHVASDFLAECGQQYDFAGQMLGDKASSVWFDNSKIKAAVPEFHCTVSMAEGLRAVTASVLAHSELHIPDPAFDAWCDRAIEAQRRAAQWFLERP